MKRRNQHRKFSGDFKYRDAFLTLLKRLGHVEARRVLMEAGVSSSTIHRLKATQHEVGRPLGEIIKRVLADTLAAAE